MRGPGMLVGFLLVMILTIRVGVVNTNRLLSDVKSYEDRIEYQKDHEERSEVLTKAKEDLFKEEGGYSNEEGTVHLENNLTETDAVTRILGKTTMSFSEPLFLTTDTGTSQLTQPIPGMVWKYDKEMSSWDGTNVTLKDELGVTYKFFNLSIGEGDDSRLKAIYNLDYYQEVAQRGTFPLPLQNGVGILVKLKDNSVVSYNILNREIDKDYRTLMVYNLKGGEVLKIERDAVKEFLFIKGSPDKEMVEGHKIRLSFSNMKELRLNVVGHSLVRVDFGGMIQEIPTEQTSKNISLEGLDSVELSIFGTDLIQMEIFYKTLIKI